MLFHVVNDLDSDLNTTYKHVVKYLIVTLIFVFIFSFNIEINENAEIIIMLPTAKNLLLPAFLIEVQIL